MKTKDYFNTLYGLLINAFEVAYDDKQYKLAMQKYKEFIQQRGLSDDDCDKQTHITYS